MQTAENSDLESGNARLWGGLFYLSSLVFFVLGFCYPIMHTKVLGGWVKNQKIFLSDSVVHFFDSGEYFIGMLILLFSIIFPAVKYFFVGAKVFQRGLNSQHWLSKGLDLLNKWAMLDVYVVALVVLNMKMNDKIISTTISLGTTLFAISVVLLMVSNTILKKLDLAKK
jgi:paraquat-inducible protein A